MSLAPSRNLGEALVVGGLTLGFGLLVGAMATSSPMLGAVCAVALGGLLTFLVAPDKRVLCLVGWIVVQPLSIEKILYTGVPLWAGLRGSEIVMNGGDAVLVVLAAVLLFDRSRTLRRRFAFDRTAILFLLLALWGIVSHLIHLLIYRDAFVDSGLLGILHLFRNFAFVVLVGSAIRDRSDLIWASLATMTMVLFESGLVFLSYVTRQDYNFARLIGIVTVGLQKYSGQGEDLIRASGTLGVSNQQALFQVMFALLLTGLLAVRNGRVRSLAAIAIAASLMAIVLTFSRTAWLSSVAAIVLIVSVLVKRGALSPRAWLAGAAALMLSAVALGFFAQPVVDRLTRGDDGATASRVRMIELARDLIALHPIIGVGPSEYVEAGLLLDPPGSSEPVWLEPGEKPIVPPLGRIELASAVIQGVGEISVPLSVHNKYLLTFSELGIVGLGLWLAIFWCFCRDALRSSQARDPFLRSFGLGGLGLCAVALIHMTLDLFSDDKTLQELLFPLILVGAAARIVRRAESPARR